MKHIGVTIDDRHEDGYVHVAPDGREVTYFETE